MSILPNGNGCIRGENCSELQEYCMWCDRDSEWETDDEKTVVCDDEIAAEPCPICFEKIEDDLNITITTCGHKFHSSCIFTALERSDNCPLCRNQLVEMNVASDDDESDDGEEGERVAQHHFTLIEEEEEEEVGFKVDLEQLADKMANIGYTMKDLLRLYVGIIFVNDTIKSSATEERYSEEFMNIMELDVDDILYGKLPCSQHLLAQDLLAQVGPPVEPVE